MDQATTVTPDADNDGWEWARVEIFGHREHWGRTREEERFGAKMLRVDIPIKGDAAANGWATLYYGGSAIFSFTLTDEATAIRQNKPWQPPSRISLPAPEQTADDGAEDDGAESDAEDLFGSEEEEDED